VVDPVETPCRACGYRELELALDLGKQPLAGGFLAGPEAIGAERRYPLRVFVCGRCSLIQIIDVIDPDILFQDYSFSSSTIPALVSHFQDYARWLVERFAPQRVVEFGCNDGVLLEPLRELGVDAWGVDISANITDLARDKGLQVLTGFFDGDTAREIEARSGRAEVVTGSNAFAHNEEPDRILEGVKAVLTPDGHLCLEVMYAGDLLELMQWDTLYHEHLTFYSLETLRTLLERHGFYPVHAERIPMHGGSLRVAAALSPAPLSDELLAVERYEREIALNEPATWLEFGSRVDRKIDVVRDVFGVLRSTKRIWGYGAAGKATMWVNACGMDYLEAMVDASPFRAGKLMPGTHTPIVFPEEMRRLPPDLVFVTAWNYVDGITKNEAWYAGTWATPLPELRFF
jgi:novobiocin biosynthesis protein NovU/D-mycarose 3-C-methyltransferase